MSDLPDDVRYPSGTVRTLLQSSHVSAATRLALEARIVSRNVSSPRCFTDETLAILNAVASRLAPEAEPMGLNVASMIDTRLADGTGNGWRYDVLPPDAEAYRQGLTTINDHARAVFHRAFVALDDAEKDVILHDVQAGIAGSSDSANTSLVRFFEELLAEVTEYFYSHPLSQESIGYAGMADLPSWNAIALGTLEQREPRAMKARE